MSVSGIVFDLQRSNVNDGPGIRTSVFLKGCSLRCAWCHNPESQALRPQLSFRRDLCMGCRRCAAVCPNDAHKFEETGHTVRFERCAACGACVRACPANALRLLGRRTTAEEVADEAERDRPFYERSGGGVTLTGGEPMYQFEFACEVLRLCRERGLHTCMETCGAASREKYAQAAALTDLFLFDYKATPAALHRDLTGADSGEILSNLAFLYEIGAKVVLRCPLVPGVNDTPEHLRAIAALSQRYPGLLGVEVMAYHDMGKGKRRQIGLPPSPVTDGIPSADEAVKRGWLAQLRELGCERAILG